MTIKCLMVELDPEGDNDATLGVAAHLAGRYASSVIGITTRSPTQMLYSNGYVVSQMLEADETKFQQNLKRTEERFRSAMHGRTESIAWRFSTVLEPSSGYLAQQARSADLIVVGGGHRRAAVLGGLVIRAGRPVLVVPSFQQTAELDHVLIAWRDTREARRATLDAMPFILKARTVNVVEIAGRSEEGEARHRLEDVVGWLRRHGVKAEASVLFPSGENAEQLSTIVKEYRANLIVAGAYGHTRIAEWIFGGVTRSLLTEPECCALLSH